jgi:thiamine transport system permease protein
LYSFFTVFIFSFLSFTTPLLLGGRYPTLELLVYIYATSFASTDLVASLVLLGLLSSAVLALPLLRIPAPPPAEPAPRTPAVGPVPTAFSLGVALYFFAVAFYIFSPLLEPRGVDAVVQPLFNSFAVALTASAAVLLVVLAFMVSDSVGLRLPALTYVVTVSLSKSLFALGFFHMAQPLYGTLLILTAAHSVVIAPLAYSLVKPSWEKIRIDTRKACVLYLGPLKCVTQIISEALGPTLVQTWLVALASSLSETTLALMLTTGGAATLSAEAVRLLTSRAPDLIEMGHFYSAVLALLVLVLLAASRLIKPRPYSI